MQRNFPFLKFKTILEGFLTQYSEHPKVKTEKQSAGNQRTLPRASASAFITLSAHAEAEAG
jgi:hypothetical protein